MEIWFFLAALLCWLAHTLYYSALLLKGGRTAAVGTVCIYMGSQADVAEWFIRSIYRNEGVLTGRLRIAVAVDSHGDDTDRILRILSSEKEFRLIGSRGFLTAGERDTVGAWMLDVRGMDKKNLCNGPLQRIKEYGRQRNI